MARTLAYLGLAVLAATVCLVLAGEAGWVPSDVADPGFYWGVRIGGGALAVALLLGLADRLWGAIWKGRCARCGVRIERGQTYCLDHLQETVNEYRDKARWDGL